MCSHRSNAVLELISTETTYVQQLQFLLHNYVNGFRGKHKWLTASEFDVLFPPDLLSICNLNTHLLKGIYILSPFQP